MAIPSALLQIAKSNPMIQKAKQMMSILQGSQNPQAMLNQMIVNNPQLKQVMDLVNKYGGDPDKALESVAQQYGISKEDIYDLMK